MSVNYLAEIADAILAAGVAALVEATTGRPGPGNAFVSHGPPATDKCCDTGMLTVHLLRLNHHVSFVDELPQSPCGVEHRPTFLLTLARCYPGQDAAGKSPATSTIDSAASDLLEDLWALVTELSDRISSCSLFDGQADCGDAEIGEVAPLDPETTGCGGWTIEVALNGTNDSGPDGS